MVLQKRLDYGFNGYQIPPTPRATRSPRRRVPFKKRHEENKMCAFDLLAVVAGKLLLDGESVPSSSNTSTEIDQNRIVNDAVVKEVQDEEIPSKIESHDQENPASTFLVPEPLPQVPEQHSSSQQCSHTENGLNLGLASGITASDCSERLDAEKFVRGKSNKEIGTSASKEEVGSTRCREFANCDLEGENKSVTNDELPMSGAVVNGTVAEMCSTEDQIVWEEKSPAPISSEGNVKGLLHRNQNPCSSYPATRGDVNVVSRDDDENSSGCTHPINMRKTYRPAPRIGNRRIRKILASRYWKVAPRLKDMRVPNTDGDLKPAQFMKKNYYKHQRSERMYPFKKRRHFEWSSPSNSDGGISSEFITKSLQNGKSGEASGSYLNLHGATGESSSVTGQNTSFQARDSHVKLRIKSFRVPELFIEIPESATVGSLKRTVMEAVTALLGGGLRIGVLLQGKKVRDDNKTLLQTGISHKNHSDALGFSLEPSSLQTHTLRPGDSRCLLPCEAPQPISSYPPTTTVVRQDSCAASPEPHALNMVNFIESDHDSAPSPTNMTIGKSITDSKALVPVPANVQALAVIQPQRKSKHSEMAQRRIRRPFSVAEVEALVQAVEKLGTGRWRDVKLRAFDDAKHRTYVDLKDKWKTLVHTARISPQQRRGEPVPQELLDRVLTAHAYWSQQQAKQQLKPSQPETCLLL